MATIDVQVKVAKEAHELGVGLVAMTKAVKQALDDGWQTGEDMPAIVTAAVTQLAPAVQGLEKLDDEWREHPGEVSKAVALLASDLVDVLSQSKAKDAPSQ